MDLNAMTLGELESARDVNRRNIQRGRGSWDIDLELTRRISAVTSAGVSSSDTCNCSNPYCQV